jgi:hypothetical protein
MNTISVPKTPASAFNPKRRASKLLTSQILHLEWALRPAPQRQPKDFKKIKPPKTEGEAAARIEALTRQLHPAGAKRRRPVRTKGKSAKKKATSAKKKQTRRKTSRRG